MGAELQEFEERSLALEESIEQERQELEQDLAIQESDWKLQVQFEDLPNIGCNNDRLHRRLLATIIHNAPLSDAEIVYILQITAISPPLATINHSDQCQQKGKAAMRSPKTCKRTSVALWVRWF